MATTVCFQSSSHIYLYSVDVHVYILVDLAADEDGSSGWFPTPSHILQSDSTTKPWPISAQNKLQVRLREREGRRKKVSQQAKINCFVHAIINVKCCLELVQRLRILCRF